MTRANIDINSFANSLIGDHLARGERAPTLLENHIGTRAASSFFCTINVHARGLPFGMGGSAVFHSSLTCPHAYSVDSFLF